MSNKCNGYAALIDFNLDSAKIFFGSTSNDAAMIKAIDDNTKVLNALKDIADNFAELKRSAPSAIPIIDTVTGQSAPSASDQKTLDEYYKSIMSQSIKNVNDVSVNMAKLKSPDLQKYARLGFLRYGAIRNILDNQTFAIKKQKADIRVKDVAL